MAAVELSYDVFEGNDLNPNAFPIILAHGFFWNKFMFRELGEKLSQAMKCRVYSIDLRNHGDSPAPKGLTLKLMAEDVKKFIEDQGLEKVNFVCHSISSKVAYLVLLDEPDRVEKVVMIDCPPFYAFSETYTAELVVPQVTSQNRLLHTLDKKLSLAQAKSRFYSLASKGDKSQEYFYKKAAYDLTKVNGEFKWKIDLNYLLQRYKEQHLTCEVKGNSNHDILLARCVNSLRIPDERFEEIIKENPRAKLVTFEDTTHLLMFERPEKFIEIVKEFLTTPSDKLEIRRIV